MEKGGATERVCLCLRAGATLGAKCVALLPACVVDTRYAPASENAATNETRNRATASRPAHLRVYDERRGERTDECMHGHTHTHTVCTYQNNTHIASTLCAIDGCMLALTNALARKRSCTFSRIGACVDAHEWPTGKR